MATLDELAALANGLPEVTEGIRGQGGYTTWFVGKKVFAWERPFSKADLRRFAEAVRIAQTDHEEVELGDLNLGRVPSGPIAALATSDLAEKEALIAAHGPAVFTIPHFNGYSAVLVQLDRTPVELLRTLVTDAWLAVAPPALAQEFMRGDGWAGGRVR
jgi:hypothetical protein